MGTRETVKQRSRIRHDIKSCYTEELPTQNSNKKSTIIPLWKKIKWQQLARSGDPAILFWVTITTLTILFFVEDPYSPDSSRVTMIDYAEKVNIIFPWQLKSNRHLFPLPDMLSRPGHGEEDFGNLDFHPRSSFSDPISIHYADFHDAEHQREDFLNNIHDSDDDRYQPESSKEDRNNPCRKVNWAGWSFPTCNQIHEKVINRLGDEGYQVSYIRSGSFRDAFRFQRQDPPDHFVMKQIILGNLGIEDVADIKKEAMILERLTPSPRVLDIYGYCGTSVVVEPMAEDLHTKIIVGTGYTFQKKLDKLDDVYPLNNFTASEKLQISLDMAESLADLHGFEGGAIIHADTHIEQWLIAPDRSIKLNDFNNAREPTWNVKKNKYCEKTSTYGGVWRSPEEYIGRPQDESIDVYAYGNNIYTLLTGLWPYYDEESRKVSRDQIQQGIIDGKRPFVDVRYSNRTLIEKKLVEIMVRCWAPKRQDRPTIFEIVKYMRESKAAARKAGELQLSTRIKMAIATG